METASCLGYDPSLYVFYRTLHFFLCSCVASHSLPNTSGPHSRIAVPPYRHNLALSIVVSPMNPPLEFFAHKCMPDVRAWIATPSYLNWLSKSPCRYRLHPWAMCRIVGKVNSYATHPYCLLFRDSTIRHSLSFWASLCSLLCTPLLQHHMLPVGYGKLEKLCTRRCVDARLRAVQGPFAS
ncbi:hypothetical protein BJ165DRAFT_471035 [Panaeolus papilionaceus]|nr:hypothetical protein BJ165DRAFT_471035 [Panaeolus papilionaceus]